MSDIRFSANFDAVLAKMEEAQSRLAKTGALDYAATVALFPIKTKASQLVTQPGRSDYTPRYGKVRKSRLPLKDLMVINTRAYRNKNRFVGVVGPMYAKRGGGNHGHLVERGHRIVRGGSAERVGKYAGKLAPLAKNKTRGTGSIAGQVDGKPFLAPAVAQHQNTVEKAFVDAIANWISDTARGVSDG